MASAVPVAVQPVVSELARADDPRAAADRLFASTTIVDLLILLCRDPSRRYYVNELIRRTSRFPRSIQLALASLEAAGIVTSERQANVRYYQVALTHPFYPDLSSMMAKISDVSGILSRSLRDVASVRVAFLRPGDADASDIELIVVVDDGGRDEVRRTVESVSIGLSQSVRVVDFTVDEWLRQSRRDRSYVRWLLEEERRYVVGSDDDLPGSSAS